MSLTIRQSDQDVQEALAPLAARSALPWPLRSFLVCVPVLTVVLLVQALVFGTGFGVSADEFALLTQVDALEDGSWTRPHPFPQVDPDRTAFPDHHAAVTPAGFAPYAKHPMAPLLLWGTRQLAGPFGLRAFVILGHVFAAVAVARVVRRVAPASSMTAFWLVGVASPLALHAHVLWMHSWAIALAALATECALVLERRPAARVPGLPEVALAGSLAGLILLRSEGILFAAAVAGALVLLATRRRSVALTGLAVCVGAWSAAVWVAESWWVQHLVGNLQYSSPSPQPAFISGRFSAVVLTYLLGGSAPWSALIMLLSVVLFLIAGWLIRHGSPARIVLVVGLVAAGLHLAVLYAPSSKLVPGMLPALPMLFVPLLLPRGRDEMDHPVVRYLAVLYLVLVGLTAHAGGAGLDWGGRYASLAVPALAGLAATRLSSDRTASDRRSVSAVAAVLVVVTAAAGPVVPLKVSAQTRKVARIEAAIETRSESAVPTAATGRPVFITQDVRLGRVLATRLDEVTALRAETDDQLGSLLTRLRAASVTEVVLVGFDDLEVSDVARRAGWEADEVDTLTDGMSARTLTAQ